LTHLQLAQTYINDRIAFRYQVVKQHPSQKKFLKGWLNRDNALLQYVNTLHSTYGY
jgi:hypothetical protein